MMCEGPHDTAFISRILRVMGCGNDKTQIGVFPKNLSNYLKSQYTPNVDTYPIYNARGNALTPNYGLNYKNEILFLLYNMGGDSKKDNRLKTVNYFLKLFQTEMATPETIGFELHIVYEFDADQVGREQRIIQVNNEIREIVPDFPGIAHGEYSIYNHIKWGAFIFTAPEEDKGKLEDMILPLMRIDNEDLFEDIEQVSNKRQDYNLYHLHMEKMNKDKWDKAKALIGMAGQLNKCGSANAAIIEQSCLVTDDQIKANKSCMDIGTYLLKGSSYVP